MATDIRRCYCHIRVDSTFNAVEEWSREMVDKGLSVDVGWDWSENTKLEVK